MTTFYSNNAIIDNVLVSLGCMSLYWSFVVSVCIPILETKFPEWLSGSEPLPHTPGAVRQSSCVCSVLRAHAQFCRFDKADAITDVQ